MRKEGVIIIIVGLLMLLLSINHYHFFNAFALFILAGGIIGTPISLPGGLMLAISLLAITGILAWPFRDALNQKLTYTKKLIKPLYSKRHQV